MSIRKARYRSVAGPFTKRNAPLPWTLPRVHASNVSLSHFTPITSSEVGEVPMGTQLRPSLTLKQRQQPYTDKWNVRLYLNTKQGDPQEIRKYKN